MPTPQVNTVVPPKLSQDLNQEVKEMEEAYKKNQRDLDAAQADWQVAQIEGEIASAELDKERAIEKALAPVIVAEKARDDARKKLQDLKGEPGKIARLEGDRDSKKEDFNRKKLVADQAGAGQKQADEAAKVAKELKDAADKAATEAQKALEKAEADLKTAKEDEPKLTPDERAKAQEARRALAEAESEFNKAEARYKAEELEAKTEFTKGASDARKRQLAIMKALSSKPSAVPAAG